MIVSIIINIIKIINIIIKCEPPHVKHVIRIYAIVSLPEWLRGWT